MLAGHWHDFKVETLPAESAGETFARWQALSANLAEPSGFNAPELQLPILKHLANNKLATVSHGPDLLLAIPIAEGRSFNARAITPLSPGGTPHLGESLKEATVAAFLKAQHKPFLFKAIAADGPFHALLKKSASRYFVLESWSRAGLKLHGTFAAWLENNFDQKRRKEFKRLRNRLGEQGDLQIKILEPGDAAGNFVAEFLTLEASGWKGKQGTAIAADVKLTTAMGEAADLLHAAGKLRFWSLKLNGRAIASLYAIVEGNQAWLGKIAYDESFAKFSPGALIILDCTESLFAEKNLVQVDSSAIPDHPLIDRIWRDRLPMISVFVAAENVSFPRFIITSTLVRYKQKWRSKLRDIYYKAKGKKRS